MGTILWLDVDERVGKKPLKAEVIILQKGQPHDAELGVMREQPQKEVKGDQAV